MPIADWHIEGGSINQINGGRHCPPAPQGQTAASSAVCKRANAPAFERHQCTNACALSLVEDGGTTVPAALSLLLAKVAHVTTSTAATAAQRTLTADGNAYDTLC